MTQADIITRDRRSYRQGLVLGLTMAEVFLLLVFALLIALGTLWTAERQKRQALEGQAAPAPVVSPAEQKLLEEIRAAIRSAGPERVAELVALLREGRHLEPLTGPEKEFLAEARKEAAGVPARPVSDHWTQLTRLMRDREKVTADLDVAEVVNRALPDEKDRARLAALIEKGLAAERKGEHDWPPIISLSEAGGYRFEKAQAELTAEFERSLRSHVIPQIQQLARQYGVTTIEVIGHTDEQRIVQRTSNLDWFILDVLRGGKVSTLIPADNAGLGLARASAVARILMQDDHLRDYSVLPLSGGQLIGIDDKVTAGGGGDERERRRIEIRLRRANQPVAGAPPAARQP